MRLENRTIAAAPTSEYHLLSDVLSPSEKKQTSILVEEKPQLTKIKG